MSQVPGVPPWAYDPAGRGLIGDPAGQSAEARIKAELTGGFIPVLPVLPSLSDNVHATTAAEAAAANGGDYGGGGAASSPTSLRGLIDQAGGAGGILGGPTNDPSSLSPNGPNGPNWLSDLMGTFYGLFQRFGIIIAAIVLMGLGAYALIHETTIREAARNATGGTT